ncbi:hypothetical protein AB6A40_000304 [Gnathostoma spinigerum]|uniref:Peptidyl-prolyl cis-trans isomerase n=1 Tax=Gnathostoma spinigerum TaxID=75299 RepID=A0ABD6E1V1_9BILA
MAVLLETTLGDIVIDLFVDERPKCCLNFLKLCKIKYYNLCQFYLVEQNYIAQTGDPSGTGSGGESIFAKLYGDNARYFEQELVPKMRHTRIGLVSMVNNGHDMLGSQFFITLGDNLDFLDNKHTIFGQVTEGFSTVTELNSLVCDENKRPYRDVRIAHTIVLDDPFDNPARLEIPSRSPSPDISILDTSQIALDQKVCEDEGKTEQEIRKEMEAKDMASQAQILEMVGDLRHADDKPVDNVLFICKLNPVTTDEDLEIIFSRFGAIKCCEVIRDRRTGASLQYAFIEFEKSESCENAYLKMDNVLIDDRRIHVDFSQSVAKSYQWHGRTVERRSATKRKHRDESEERQSGDKLMQLGREVSASSTTKNRIKKHEDSRTTKKYSSKRSPSPRKERKHRSHSHKGRRRSRSHSPSDRHRHRASRDSDMKKY